VSLFLVVIWVLIFAAAVVLGYADPLHIFERKRK
jgi:type IV secretory pathway TrbD component